MRVRINELNNRELKEGGATAHISWAIKNCKEEMALYKEKMDTVRERISNLVADSYFHDFMKLSEVLAEIDDIYNQSQDIFWESTDENQRKVSLKKFIKNIDRVIKTLDADIFYKL